MQKSKTQSAKVKKTATKYPKLLVVAENELENEKKALVLAERALQKAKQKHEELVASIARLDMLARSLKAFVEGTEPPTNVRYVYNYPQWVWQPTYTYPNYPQSQPNWNYYSPSITSPGIYTPNYTVTCQNSGLTSDLLQSNTIASSGVLSTSVGDTQYNLCSTSSGLSSTPESSFTVDLSTHAEVVEPEYLEATASSSE